MFGGGARSVSGVGRGCVFFFDNVFVCLWLGFVLAYTIPPTGCSAGVFIGTYLKH